MSTEYGIKTITRLLVQAFSEHMEELNEPEETEEAEVETVAVTEVEAVAVTEVETVTVEKTETVTKKEKKPKKEKKIKKTKQKSKTVSLKEKVPITLFDYQKVHVDVMKHILDESPYAFDFSMLGTGKTYSTCFIYDENIKKTYKHLVIIAPVSVKTKWKSVTTEHDIKIDNLISFCEVRTVKFKQPKHGLLTRRDFMKPIQMENGSIVDMEKTDFTYTQKYLDMIKEGTLLVIDEIQNVKNMNNQLDACKELIRPIIEAYNCDKNSPSRVVLLSGSPVDKKVQIVHFYRLLNIMVNDRLSVYNPQTREIMWRGMKEIEEYCVKNFSKVRTDEIKQSIGMDPRYPSYYGWMLESYCYSLFKKLIIPKFSNAMEPVKIPVVITKRNAYYAMGDKTNTELLKKGVGLLKQATRFNHENQTVDMGHNGAESLRGITRALILIETSKIKLFARIAQKALDTNPKQKVVICVNYTETINDLLALLSKYNPLRLDGSMSHIRRGEVLKNFQSGNTTNRLLVGNITVCSSGIDLDDQHGTYPRLCLVSPNYSTILLYQLSHRFHRINTKSNSLIHFVLCKEATELPILNALARKSNVMKEITDSQVKNGVIFPGDYQSWYE